MVKGNVILGVDSKIIHVDFEPFLTYHISKDMVHKCLKGGWSIGKSEKHDCQFKKAFWSDECSFPLVFFLNPDVVMAPLDVEFGK